MGMLGLGILLFIFPSKESGKRNTPALARGILSHGNTNVFLAFPVLAWLLVSAAITAKCLHLLATSSPIPIPVWIWLVPVSGIAGGVWLWRLWQDLQQWPSRTLMLQSPVRLGGPFEGFIEGNERLALTGEYRLQLACLVNTKEDSDGLRIHPSQVVWETEQTLGRDRLDETGPEKRIPFRFELPATLPPGPFPADIVKDYSWQLTAKVRIAGKRWEDSFSGALPGVVAGQPTPERIP